MTNGLVHTLTRKERIVDAQPGRYGYLRAAADTLDRRLVDAATVELLAEALYRLVDLVYSQDAAGWVTVDGATGRILIPAPWGRAGRSAWGLYPSEGDTLRSILRHRRRGPVPPLWVYNRERRAWFVNLEAYPDLRSALAYLKAQPIGIEEYRLHHKRTTRRR